MERSWLIRTKNNHILGPVSRAKVLELIEKGSIKGEDEVCDGNGYWFGIKENELVEKYLRGNLKQEFNPVSEANTILANQQVSKNDGDTKETDKQQATYNLPSEDDLEYPNENSKGPSTEDLCLDTDSQSNSTLVLDLDQLKNKLQSEGDSGPDLNEQESESHKAELNVLKVASAADEDGLNEDDLSDDVNREDTPDSENIRTLNLVQGEKSTANEENINPKELKKNKVIHKRKVKSKSEPSDSNEETHSTDSPNKSHNSKKQRSDRYLIVLACLFLAAAIAFFVYRKQLIREYFSSSLSIDKVSFFFISKVNAQVTDLPRVQSKKKNYPML